MAIRRLAEIDDQLLVRYDMSYDNKWPVTVRNIDTPWACLGYRKPGGKFNAKKGYGWGLFVWPFNDSGYFANLGLTRKIIGKPTEELHDKKAFYLIFRDGPIIADVGCFVRFDLDDILNPTAIKREIERTAREYRRLKRTDMPDDKIERLREDLEKQDTLYLNHLKDVNMTPELEDFFIGMITKFGEVQEGHVNAGETMAFNRLEDEVVHYLRSIASELEVYTNGLGHLKDIMQGEYNTKPFLYTRADGTLVELGKIPSLEKHLDDTLRSHLHLRLSNPVVEFDFPEAMKKVRLEIAASKGRAEGIKIEGRAKTDVVKEQGKADALAIEAIGTARAKAASDLAEVVGPESAAIIMDTMESRKLQPGSTLVVNELGAYQDILKGNAERPRRRQGTTWSP